MTIGSSWSTAGTLGIALIGIASVLGLSLEITAGAIISGAYFGDKLSPLSDTTNLASGVAGIDLFDHIRYMLWTTLPAMTLALLLYTLLALNTDIGQTQDSDVLATRAALAQHYQIGLIPLLPLLLILVMAARGIPAYPTLAAGSIAGVVIALTYQRDAVLLFGDPTQTLSVTEALVRAVWQAMGNGFSLTSGNQALDTLLSRGGMSSMLNTVWLIISAMVFGSAMERTGMLRRLVEAILKGVRSIGSLVTATVITCVGINILSGDQYMSIVLPGRMFRLEYRRQGLDSANLSRTLEDAGTMTSALIPWNTCGAFMAATLGVPTSGYAMFAFLNLMTPLFAIGYALMDFRIQRLQPAS